MCAPTWTWSGLNDSPRRGPQPRKPMLLPASRSPAARAAAGATASVSATSVAIRICRICRALFSGYEICPVLLLSHQHDARGRRHENVQPVADAKLQVITLGGQHENGPGPRSGARSDRCAFLAAGDPADDRADDAAGRDLLNVSLC